MKLIDPKKDPHLLKAELWQDCSALGEPGTKEKEQNLQIELLEKGIVVSP